MIAVLAGLIVLYAGLLKCPFHKMTLLNIDLYPPEFEFNYLNLCAMFGNNYFSIQIRIITELRILVQIQD